KPVIDIMLECEDITKIDEIAKKLQQIGFSPLGRHIIPYWCYFTQRFAENMSYNLHIHERGSPQIKRHVNFKNYVIQHTDIAAQYAALKIKLAKQFANDRFSYVLGKDKLV